VLTAQAGAKALGEKVISNADANADAALDAAQAIARARTLVEVARLQADFMQSPSSIDDRAKCQPCCATMAGAINCTEPRSCLRRRLRRTDR
jgi:hypothetical protein